MRTVRLILVVLLALLLVAFAVANRAPVTLHVMPGQFDRYLGSDLSVQVPLFMVILLSLLVGVVAGLLWEWVREGGHRRRTTRLARDVHQLEREVGGLRHTHAAPRDPVLAVLDAPAVPAATGAGVPAAATAVAVTPVAPALPAR